MSSAAVSGLHHLTLPVTDLDASLEWYQRVLGARRIERHDHVDEAGQRFAVVLEIAGLGTLLELRVAAERARALAGFAPITLAAADDAALDAWIKHLDAERVAHTPITVRRAGSSVSFTSPDATEISVYRGTA